MRSGLVAPVPVANTSDGLGTPSLISLLSLDIGLCGLLSGLLHPAGAPWSPRVDAPSFAGSCEQGGNAWTE
jgi:hypothetical protein